MTNWLFYTKLEELAILTVELSYLFKDIETTDDRFPAFKELIEELKEYV